MPLTVAVDFDGVIHDPTNRDPGYKMGKPMPGSLHSVRELMQRYTVVILTARPPESWKSIKDWLAYFGFPEMRITNIKPPAVVYIDDHGLHFQSWAQAMRDFQMLEPHLMSKMAKSVKDANRG